MNETVMILSALTQKVPLGLWGYPQGIRVNFVCEGHRVRGNVIGAKKRKIPYSRNNSGSIKDRYVKFVCTMRFSAMAHRMV